MSATLRSRWTTLVSLLAFLWPASLHAFDVYKDDKTTVLVGALVRYSLVGQNDNPNVDQIAGVMAGSRLLAGVNYDDYVRVFIQYDGVQGLLDAFGELKGDHFGFRAGRLRTNTTGEFSTILAELPTYRRAELIKLAPRWRVGVDTWAGVDLGEVSLQADVGLFNLRADTTIGVDDGQLLMERIYVDLEPLRLRIHASFVHHVFSTNFDPVNLQPVFPNDQQLDISMIFDSGEGSRGLFEYFRVLDGPNNTSPQSVYVMVAQEIQVGASAWEFALAYDYFDEDTGQDLHRAQINANFLVLGHHFVPSLAYAVTIRPLNDKVSHTGVLQLQAAF